MNWFPKIGWAPISYSEAYDMGLNLNFVWEAWGIIWLDYCLFFYVRPREVGV